jgi:hypothetical protein
VHDDLALGLTAQSKVSEQELMQRYEVRQIEEPLGPGEVLRIQLLTKVLDEPERRALVQDPNAIGAVWPNSLALEPSELVSHITDRAWQALDYDPSGLAHEDFEGGHSTYRTPNRLTRTVVFVHHGALVVVHATIEIEHRSGAEPEERELVEKYEPTLARVMQRLRRGGSGPAASGPFAPKRRAQTAAASIPAETDSGRRAAQPTSPRNGANGVAPHPNFSR